MAEAVEDSSLTTFKAAEELITKLLCPKEKRKVRLHQFYEARLTDKEKPRQFVQRLRELLKAGMPYLNSEGQEELLMEHLPRVVPSRWQVKLLDSDATNVEGLVRRLERLKTVEQLHHDMSKKATRGDKPGEVCAETETLF